MKSNPSKAWLLQYMFAKKTYHTQLPNSLHIVLQHRQIETCPELHEQGGTTWTRQVLNVIVGSYRNMFVKGQHQISKSNDIKRHGN